MNDDDTISPEQLMGIPFGELLDVMDSQFRGGYCAAIEDVLEELEHFNCAAEIIAAIKILLDDEDDIGPCEGEA